jgi:hypothetical protein
MSFLRGARNMEDMMQDPNFRFNVYRHIGASEMVAYWLKQQDDPIAKMYGDKLGKIVDWFFTDHLEGKLGGWE